MTKSKVVLINILLDKHELYSNMSYASIDNSNTSVVFLLNNQPFDTHITTVISMTQYRGIMHNTKFHLCQL